MQAKSRNKLPTLAIYCAALTASCAAESIDYEVPDSICQIPIAREELSPLLPNGKSLTETKRSASGSTVRSCYMSVDHHAVVYVSISVVNEFQDPMSELQGHKFTERKAIWDLPFEGTGALGNESAMISVPCRTSDGSHLITDVHTGEKANRSSDINRHRKEIKVFAVSLASQAKKTFACGA